MKYLIDDANIEHIQETLSMGIYGVTANPTMYTKNKISLTTFLQTFQTCDQTFLSGEVMQDNYEDMLLEAEGILNISKNIVIKINFSKAGLQLCKELHLRGVKTAMTLVFSLPQCAASINAGADYIFFFIGRNEDQGSDGLAILRDAITLTKETNSHMVAASIKHIYHLQELCKINVEYAALPYELYMKSLEHPLTTSGYAQFKQDWDMNT